MESTSEDRSTPTPCVATEELFSGSVFRGTRLNAVFVRRRGVLYPEVLATYRDPVENVPPRLWLLTNECEIEPVAPARFLVAEDGWAPLLARLMYKTYALDGFVISLSWPRSRMMADTVLVLAFETEEMAAEWRTALTNAIMGAHCRVGRGNEENMGARETTEITPVQRISPFADQNHLQVHRSDALNLTPASQERLATQPDSSSDPATSRNWHAIKELNGLTVYYEEDATGGAYMVSTLIHAHPKRVLDALTTGSFLLCCGDVSLVRRDCDLEILHLKLHPVGLGYWFLGSRELLIERMWMEYASGMVGVLFKSCEERVSDTPKHQKPWWSWFTTPTQAYIPAAGFTVSPMDATGGAHRVDSWLTLVLKIDFGGVCSAEHPLKAVMDGLGICQTWIDRMLLTVTDLKVRLETEPKVELRDRRREYLSHRDAMRWV